MTGATTPAGTSAARTPEGRGSGGRRMLRIEARNARTPVERNRPEWLRTRLSAGPDYQDVRRRMVDGDLHTVCREAGCPNIHECWEDREATFLIGGDRCTRRCDFCQITSARPRGYDTAEPLRVARSVERLGLRYATVTGVARDDRPDGGAWLYAETARQVHELSPGTGVELLIHVGLDTVNLEGKGFDVLVKQGDSVTAGQELVRVDRTVVEEAGYSLTTPVLITNTPKFSSVEVIGEGEVDTGAPLIRVTAPEASES
mgnify:CR=1 FL=1